MVEPSSSTGELDTPINVLDDNDDYFSKIPAVSDTPIDVGNEYSSDAESRDTREETCTVAQTVSDTGSGGVITISYQCPYCSKAGCKKEKHMVNTTGRICMLKPLSPGDHKFDKQKGKVLNPTPLKEFVKIILYGSLRSGQLLAKSFWILDLGPVL